MVKNIFLVLVVLTFFIVSATFLYPAIKNSPIVLNKPNVVPTVSEAKKSQMVADANEFKSKIKPLSAPKINYSTWETYVNKTHSFALKYPKGWVLDSSKANNIEDYKDDSCCNYSRLTITDGNSTWNLTLDEVWTGGTGPDIAYYNQCNQDTAGADHLCERIYQGPINISGLQLYKMLGAVKSSQEVLYVNLGQFGDTGIMPVFFLKAVPGSDMKRAVSITYSGSSLKENMDMLDGITFSLKGLE